MRSTRPSIIGGRTANYVNGASAILASRQDWLFDSHSGHRPAKMQPVHSELPELELNPAWSAGARKVLRLNLHSK
jgi:hypothetical protein